MQNNFELNHYPRKYGKTHLLVNKMFDYIYKTNVKKRIVIYVEDEKQVEYLSDVITCNLDYKYEITKRYKGKTNNKFISPEYVIIVGTYKFHLKNRKQDDTVDLVLFDELPKENNFEYMEYVISKYNNAEFKAYYTSKHCNIFGPFQKDIFNELILNKFSEESIDKLIDIYGNKVLSEAKRLSETIYNTSSVNFILNEKNVLDNFITKTKDLNKKDLETRDLIQRVLFSAISSMQVKYFGMLLIDKKREEKINELYDIFKSKLDEFEKE